VKKTMDRHKRCIVAVSEGVTMEDGRSLVEHVVPAEKLERDAHGNLKLSGTDLGAAFEQALADGMPGKRARVDTLGYLPRGAISMISPADAREAFNAGAFAVEAAGKGGGSVALQYDGKGTVTKLVPLSNVAGKTRHMPDDFLHASESRVSATGMAYLQRLLPKKFEIGKPFV
jgi:ATP-dependent phosphofructokinase / diphosphate-dependent phosphofructokinase